MGFGRTIAHCPLFPVAMVVNLFAAINSIRIVRKNAETESHRVNEVGNKLLKREIIIILRNHAA